MLRDGVAGIATVLKCAWLCSLYITKRLFLLWRRTNCQCHLCVRISSCPLFATFESLASLEAIISQLPRIMTKQQSKMKRIHAKGRNVNTPCFTEWFILAMEKKISLKFDNSRSHILQTVYLLSSTEFFNLILLLHSVLPWLLSILCV